MIKKISNIAKKYKFFAFAYFTFEILTFMAIAIPAHAQAVDRVSFTIPQRVITATIPNQRAGAQLFLVSSNAPFAITAENAIGEFNIALSIDGTSTLEFGTHAQMPGEATACTNVSSTLPIKIYEATQKTAAKRGDVLKQSVLVTISYDPEINPDFKFYTQEKSLDIPSAQACEFTTPTPRSRA